MGQMEMLDAAWYARLSRWIGGAQDNAVQVSALGAASDAQSFGLCNGDGTVTQVDNVHNPSRLFGSTQFLGGARVFAKKRRLNQGPWAGIPGDCQGLFCFTQGTPGIDQIAVDVPLGRWFDDPSFPYFVMQFYLNMQDPTQLVFWANGTTGHHKTGWYTLDVPAGLNSSASFKEPRFALSSQGGTVFTFVAGGTTEGRPDASVIVGVNDTHLYHLSGEGPLFIRQLPATFAAPVILGYDADAKWILGPISHGRTVFLGVSSSNSKIVAVTGWPSVENNADGVEDIWLSMDAGLGWKNVTGNLLAATATVARARPSGLLFVDYQELNASALLVGTVSGAFLTWTDGPHLGQWHRLGSCGNLPLVKVMSLSYEPYSDTLVAATFGRGVYILRWAKHALLTLRTKSKLGACSNELAWEPSSSAMYFPPQQITNRADSQHIMV